MYAYPACSKPGTLIPLVASTCAKRIISSRPNAEVAKISSDFLNSLIYSEDDGVAIRLAFLDTGDVNILDPTGLMGPDWLFE